MLNTYLNYSLKIHFLKNTGICKAAFASIFLVTMMISYSNANVTITTATGGTNIPADKAANASSPAYTTLGNIVITEGSNGDIPSGTSKTIIISAPAGWQFKAATGSVSFTAAKDITAASIAVVAATITVTVTVGGNTNIDALTISGIQIEATDGGGALASNVFITRTGGTLGNITGLNTGASGTGTSLGSLSQSLGAISQLIVTLPGQTFTDAATKAASGNSGTVTGQTAGISFNILHITATDQFFNVITTYSGAKTISYSGPSNGPTGGAPVYTTAVSFTNGIATTTLATTLKKAETTTITATDGTVAGVASSGLTVSAGALNNFLVEAVGGGTIATQTVGAAFNIQITARDAFNNTVTGYNTSGAITTNAGTISPTTTGTGYVNGVNTLSVTFTGISGSGRTITVTQGSTGTSAPFKVDPGVLNNFLVEKNGTGGNIGTQTAGNNFSIQITARDASNNALSSGINTFSGTVNLSTSTGSISPAISGSFTNGALTGLTVTLTVANASLTITATSGAVSTTSAVFAVVANSFTKLQILLPGETAAPGTVSGKTGTPTSVNSGTVLTATVNAVDAYWNVVSSATDNIHITSPDIYPATLPSNAALVSGTKSFSVTLFTGPTETITASDVTNGLIISNTSAAVTVNPATRVAFASHNWNQTTTWQGGIVPATTDYATINPGVTVTVTAAATVASITFDSTSTSTAILTVNTGILLNVTGAITLKSNNSASTGATLAGAGTIDCDSINIGGNLSSASGMANSTITSTITNLNVSGNVNLNSWEQNPSKANQAIFAIPSGTTMVNGTFNMNAVGPAHGTNKDPLLTMATGAQSGTLILNGSTPFNNSTGNAIVTLNGTGAVVTYQGSAQDVYPAIYTTLNLKGSGNKNIITGTAVNSAINILGTAKANIDNGLNITVTNLSLVGVAATPTPGTWGGASPATHINTTYFTATTGEVTVTGVPRTNPTFSGLAGSQAICYNSSFILSGTVSATGPLYPSGTETIYATINGITESGTFGINGAFTISFPVRPGIDPGSSFAINYFYGGNSSLTAIENTVFTLSVDFPSVGGTATATTSPLCSGSSTTISLASDTGTAFQWQQSANGTTGWANVSGGSGATTSTYNTPSLGSTIYYRAVVTNGACASAFSDTTFVTVNTPYTVTTGGPDFTCQDPSPTPITLSGASVGNGATTGAWSITSGTGTLSSTSQTASPATVTFTPASNVNQTVILTLLTNASGACAAVSATRTVNIFPAGEWKGTSSVNWNDAGNWCSGVPTSGTSVIVPAGTPFSPAINSTATCLNLTINSGAVLTVTTGGDLSLYGNLSLSGTYTQTAGTLELVGSATQTVPAISVANLIINNSTGGSVTLAGNVSVSGTLTLTNGVINTGGDTVIVSNSANTSMVAGSGNTNYTKSWINGYLKRSFAVTSASYDFPIGSATKGCPAIISSHSMTGVSYFTAIFAGPLVKTGNNIDSRLDAWETSLSGTNKTPYTSVNIGGSWKIEPNAQPTGGSTYDISLYFTGFTTIADNQFGILKRPVNSNDYAAFKPGGGTLNVTGGAGRMTAGGFALRKGLSSFSEFVIGQSGNVLPIELVSFTAEKCDNNQDALLKWNTASELNNDHFNVEEASVIGQNGNLSFTKIGEVKGNGTSGIPHNYSFTDVTPGKSGNRYYRLGQVDLDGTLTYSEIVDVDFSGSLILTTKLYPNPTNDVLNYFITASDNASVTISVTNITGQEIFMQETAISTGSNTLSMNVSQLKKGIYFFNINDGKSLSIHTRFEKF